MSSQIDRANTVNPHTIIAPFTTRIRRAVLPSHALIPAGIGGLTHDSVVLCEQIRVIDKRRIIRVLGHVDDTYMEEVARALRTILGLYTAAGFALTQVIPTSSHMSLIVGVPRAGRKA